MKISEFSLPLFKGSHSNFEEYFIKTILFITSFLLIFTNALANGATNALACMAGASADIDGSNSYPTDASSIRFILSLDKKSDDLSAIKIKYTGIMEGMPETWYKCSVNAMGNLYTCVNGSEVVWYYPDQKHGVIANLSISTLIKENRANAAGLYNYSCSTF